ncbi:ABC transporter permease [Microtetraspora fusca]|uniref:ABC transporter permease n=1 Tax=Microtetraspora fusca TaxID=1997 RepID=A0ABW6VIZ7_MICFU|nr:ABC transporter permease [Microtetraspora fusca]
MNVAAPSTAGKNSPAQPPERRGPALGRAGEAVREWAIRNPMVLVMVLVILYFLYMSDRFGTVGNLQTIAIAAAPFALIALGQTLVILTGGIDLSVGSVIAASAMTAALVVKDHPERMWLAVLAAVLVGVAVGAVSGFAVSRLGVPPFVATLGMMTVASGLAYVLGNGAPINGLPPGYSAIANTKVFGIDLPVIVMILGFAIMIVLMSRTTYGLRVYAVGGNPLASRIAGLNVNRTLFSVYVISGGLAGLSGVILSSRVISAFPSLGAGYELDAIAAVVIGGASLMGGRGTVWGTILGLFLIQTLNNGLDLLIVPSYWQKVIKGVLIIAAVALDVWVVRRRSR